MNMKQVLVIDDDEFSAEVAAAYLTGAGYQVVVARDGFIGLKMIRQRRPDLIISDIWMPVGTGLSLAQHLQDEGMGGVPIIFVTADRQPGLRDSATALGVRDYFEKPYNARELLATVARLLASESEPATA